MPVSGLARRRAGPARLRARAALSPSWKRPLYSARRPGGGRPRFGLRRAACSRLIGKLGRAAAAAPGGPGLGPVCPGGACQCRSGGVGHSLAVYRLGGQFKLVAPAGPAVRRVRPPVTETWVQVHGLRLPGRRLGPGPQSQFGSVGPGTVMVLSMVAAQASSDGASLTRSLPGAHWVTEVACLRVLGPGGGTGRFSAVTLLMVASLSAQCPAASSTARPARGPGRLRVGCAQ